MDLVKDAVKMWGRNEWIYWYYSKIKSHIQPYIDDTFEANQIIPNLWLGAIQSSCNREALQERNIEIIISAFLGATAMYPFDFDYERAKLRDVADENIIQEFDELLPVIHTNLQKHKGVLCHCHAGKSRSASIVAAYLIKYEGMTTEGALEFIKRKRTQIDPNAGYVEQLKQFEAKVRTEDGNKKKQD